MSGLTPELSQSFVTASDGVSLYTDVLGEGAPSIVLVDGIGCAGYIWRRLRPLLARHHRTIHAHYRAHGLSGQPAPGAVGLPDLVEDLRLVLRHHRTKRVVLCAHSFGCQVAFEFARTYPQQVAGIVTLCGSYGPLLKHVFDSELLDRTVPLAQAFIRRFPGLSQQFWGRTLRARWLSKVCQRVAVDRHLVEPEDLQAYFSDAAAMNVSTFSDMLHYAARHSVAAWLPSLTLPTLVVGGDRDEFVPTWLTHHMAQLIPNADIMVVKQGRHTAPIEHPDLIALRIEEFMRERIAKRKPRASSTTASGKQG